MYMFIIITFDSVGDRLGSPSDLVKSWGGGGSVTVTCIVLSAGSVIAGHSVVLCMSPVARPYHGAVSTGAYKGRKSQV